MVRGLDSLPKKRTTHDLAKLRMNDMPGLPCITRCGDVATCGGWGCRCSKIMSPPNCNETLSPSQDGDDESETRTRTIHDLRIRPKSCRLLCGTGGFLQAAL